jgi:hypothetical protein
MKKYSLFIILLIAFVVVFTGCGDDDDDDSSTPTVPEGGLDFTGIYQFQSTLTPTSGDCSAILTVSGTNPSGVMAFGHTSATNFTVTSCTLDSGGVCPFSGATGTIQDSLVTLAQSTSLFEITMTGTVTDPSNFTLSGQGTAQIGACQFDATGTWLRN